MRGCGPVAEVSPSYRSSRSPGESTKFPQLIESCTYTAYWLMLAVA